jgi:ankyrin repeat protein
MESFDSVKWLVEHGADLNVKHKHSFLTAVRYCGEDIIRYLVEHGAKVDGELEVGGEAFQQALYGERPENLPLIQELGVSVKDRGGNAFRSAVSPIDGEPDYAVLDFFIKNGVDINYNGADQVYPYKPTPLGVAARDGDLKLCRYLVAHGAEVALADRDGERPYTIAVERGDTEMTEYFRSLESPEFHSLQNKLPELKPYKLPGSLLDFLQGDNLRLEFGDDCGVAFVEFFRLIDTVPVTLKRQKLLRISRVVDNYSDMQFMWHPKTKMIAYYDVEHHVLGDIAPFEDFLANAAEHVKKVICGDYDPEDY